MLTEKQRKVLLGLSFGHAYLSASERGHEEIMELANADLASMWMTQGGFIAWRITEAGRAALAREGGGSP